MIDLNDYMCWEDVEPFVATTYLGFRKSDLRSKWVIRVKMTDGDWWYLLKGDYLNNYTWGELFMDHMLVMSKRDALELVQKMKDDDFKGRIETRNMADPVVLGR